MTLEAMFIGLALGVTGLFVGGVYAAYRRSGADAGRAALLAAAAAAVWLAVTYQIAERGLLRFDTMPPTAMLIFPVVLAASLVLALSPLGRRLATALPLWALVAAQAFRLPLELAMHHAYTLGVMPEQMSYSGYNFDIVTGIFSLVVGGVLLAGRGSLALVRAWNWAGVLLLANILVIAVLSAPTPLRRFTSGPANAWITRAPFVWLPMVMLLAAVTGHALVFVRLRMERAGSLASTPVSPAVETDSTPGA